MDFTVPAYHTLKNERKRNDKQILGTCQRTKKKEQWNIRVNANCS